MKRAPSAIICRFAGLLIAALGADSLGDEDSSSDVLSIATFDLIEPGKDRHWTSDP